MMYPPVSQETKQRVYKMFDKTQEQVEEDVQTIKKWLETQSHHPEIMGGSKIRNMLNLCKFDINKTKQKIDNYYSVRSKYPDLFDDSNPKLPHLKEIMDQTHISNHPILLDGIHRISFIKPKKPNTLDPKGVAMLCLALLEIRLEADFMVDDVIVIDMENITFRDMCTLTFPVLYRTFTVYKDVYSLRINSIYSLNSPSYITIFMKIMKFILPSKIFKRFKVSPDAEILKDVFVVDTLPKDYGGNGLSLNKLDEMTKEKFAKFKVRFDALDNLRIDESLRKK